MTSALLTLQGVSAWRGVTPVLRDIDLKIASGKRVALVGDNGAGKSSLLLAIAGHLRIAGTMTFAGQNIAPLPAHRRARAGIGFCPEGRRVFGGMTVADNLAVASRDWRSQTLVERIYGLFPELERRQTTLAWQLSGGEQQMLSLGRALMGGPRLLLLDEPFLGLAPEATDRLLTALSAVSQEGVSLLLADQDLERVKSLCDHLIFLDRGQLAP